VRKKKRKKSICRLMEENTGGRLNNTVQKLLRSRKRVRSHPHQGTKKSWGKYMPTEGGACSPFQGKGGVLGTKSVPHEEGWVGNERGGY